ncbi:MAG: MFS transporter [Betaproteobacteria bacterium]|nr:MFS transporter [Betaproteobacteria bacterium]
MSPIHTPRKAYWHILLAAGGVLMVTMGVRQCLGLFVGPLHLGTGVSIVALSFALAVGQFMWGATQPLFGLLAERIGAFQVMTLGAGLMALGLAATAFSTSPLGLALTFGVLVSAGAGAGSFAILISAAARALPPQQRAFAAGFINAGGSFGQFLFAPLAQVAISALGWMSALWMLAAATLVTIPLALGFTRASPPDDGDVGTAHLPAGTQVRQAFRNRSYWYLHAGYFTCGFHVAFLTTHLPGYAALCGMPERVSAIALSLIGFANIFGSLFAGWLGGRLRMKYILFGMYALRALMILVFLGVPKTALNFYIFAVGMGMTWLATVPPTAGLVGKLFGTRHLATLFGLTLLTHQVGGFFGAWLGGVAVARSGSYDALWMADALLAACAALINLPIREAPLRTAAAPAQP